MDEKCSKASSNSSEKTRAAASLSAIRAGTYSFISEVDENFDTLAKGQRVSFEEGASRRTGKLEAKNVTVVEASVERVRRYG